MTENQDLESEMLAENGEAAKDEAKEEDTCNPQLPDDLAGGEADKLKGDAIGNTLYSERFVLMVLMKLIKQVDTVEWTDELETELCNLWDMTIEKDVVLYLMKHDFLKLATCILYLPDLPHRFVEIIVGIMHNMSCVEEFRLALCKRKAATQRLLNMLSSEDSLMLVQLVKLLNSVAWDVVRQVDERNTDTEDHHWLVMEVDNERMCIRLTYILSSSTCPELLCATIELLNTLCVYAPAFSDKDFSQYFATEDLIGGLLECWNQLFASREDEREFQSRSMLKAAKQWVTIMSSFAGNEKGRLALGACGERVTSVMSTLLWLPDDQSEQMLKDVVTVLEALIQQQYKIPYILPKLLSIVHTIMRNNQQQDEMETDDVTLQEALENYFESLILHVGNRSILEDALSGCEENLQELYWSIIEKRDPELLLLRISNSDGDSVPNMCNERSI